MVMRTVRAPPRALITMGIGYGALAMATHGFWMQVLEDATLVATGYAEPRKGTRLRKAARPRAPVRPVVVGSYNLPKAEAQLSATLDDVELVATGSVADDPAIALQKEAAARRRRAVVVALAPRPKPPPPPPVAAAFAVTLGKATLASRGAVFGALSPSEHAVLKQLLDDARWLEENREALAWRLEGRNRERNEWVAQRAGGR